MADVKEKEDIRALAKYEQQATTLKNEATGLVVTNSDQHQYAGEFLKTLKKFKADVVVGIMGPFVEIARRGWKDALAQQGKVEDPVKEAEAIISQKVVAYEREEKRKADEAYEKERARLQKIADDKAQAEALKLEKKGRVEEAQQVLETAAQAPAPFTPPPPPPPKVDGLRTVKTYKFRITNAELIPRLYLTPDLVKLGQQVRATKEQTRIAGIEVYFEESKGGTGR